MPSVRGVKRRKAHENRIRFVKEPNRQPPATRSERFPGAGRHAPFEKTFRVAGRTRRRDGSVTRSTYGNRDNYPSPETSTDVGRHYLTEISRPPTVYVLICRPIVLVGTRRRGPLWETEATDSVVTRSDEGRRDFLYALCFRYTARLYMYTYIDYAFMYA